jgi:hypothetical protein
MSKDPSSVPSHMEDYITNDVLIQMVAIFPADIAGQGRDGT